MTKISKKQEEKEKKIALSFFSLIAPMKVKKIRTEGLS
jgi:hypothetical protein